jgi:DNA polymerase III alpha subunit
VRNCHELVEQTVKSKKGGQEIETREWRSRSRVGKTDLEMLIQAGACDVFDTDRERLMAMLPGLMELADKYWTQAAKVKSGKKTKISPDSFKAAMDAFIVHDEHVDHHGLEATLEAERAATGCYLSQSPFTPFVRVLKQYETCTSEDVRIGEFDTESDNGVGTFAGLLRDFRTTTIKNGKNKGAEMAFLTFTGYSSDVEVVAFSDAWARVKDTRDAAGAPMPFERGKVYLVGVRKDRDGKGAVLDDVRRLSNTNYAQA